MFVANTLFPLYGERTSQPSFIAGLLSDPRSDDVWRVTCMFGWEEGEGQFLALQAKRGSVSPASLGSARHRESSD
jgi:hypothetical protein